jgi:hypothetical protein
MGEFTGFAGQDYDIFITVPGYAPSPDMYRPGVTI